MVTQISEKEYQGLTADAKPTGCSQGSTFYELDGQKRGWIYDSNNINPVTSNNWWEV